VRANAADSRWVAERYRLDGELGSGGMGVVWRAWDDRLNRKVAVKEVLIPDGMPPAEAELLHERYLREARAAARLRHPAVVGVYDVISEAGRVWIVMELIQARDLAALLRTDGPLEPQRAAKIGLQLLDALDAAHTAGVLHRDVKPANVLICDDDRAVLTDFGVASVTGDTSLTRTGQLIGSPAYLAPERVTGGKVGPPTDLWSVGCTLYAAVQGRPPFARDEQFAIIAAITLEPIPHPESAGPLTPVLYGLLEKDTTERWDSLRTRKALMSIIAGEEIDEQPGWGSPDKTQPNRKPAAADKREPAPPVPVAAPPASGSPTVPVASAPPPRASEPDVTVLRHGPPPAPQRASGAKSALLGAIIVLLLVTIAALAVFIYRPELAQDLLKLGQGGGGSQSASPSAAPSGSPSPSSAPAAYSPTEFKHQKHGYAITVPDNWTRKCLEDGITCRFNTLSGPDRLVDTKVNSANNLFVIVNAAQGKTALALAEAENERWKVHPTTATDYQTLQLRTVTMGSYPGAVLEFTYTNKLTGPRHVLIFRTVVGKRSYEISLNCPADTFARGLPVFDRAVDSLSIGY
jgi:serine/threonine protein kinase